jgi:hypothetical protein
VGAVECSRTPFMAGARVRWDLPARGARTESKPAGWTILSEVHDPPSVDFRSTSRFLDRELGIPGPSL